jgi:hypothetical protein
VKNSFGADAIQLSQRVTREKTHFLSRGQRRFFA